MTIKTAFDPHAPDVVNGGFTIRFDRDHTGPLITIHCPHGQVVNLWEKGTDTDRPVVYAWETAEAHATEEPAYMIVMKRFGLVVERFDYLDRTLILVERSYSDADAEASNFFYTAHEVFTKEASWKVREVEGCDDVQIYKHYESYSDGCKGMGELLAELMNKRLQS